MQILSLFLVVGLGGVFRGSVVCGGFFLLGFFWFVFKSSSIICLAYTAWDVLLYDY